MGVDIQLRSFVTWVPDGSQLYNPAALTPNQETQYPVDRKLGGSTANLNVDRRQIFLPLGRLESQFPGFRFASCSLQKLGYPGPLWIKMIMLCNIHVANPPNKITLLAVFCINRLGLLSNSVTVHDAILGAPFSSKGWGRNLYVYSFLLHVYMITMHNWILRAIGSLSYIPQCQTDPHTVQLRKRL